MDQAVALNEHGLSLWQQGDLESAQAIFERLLELARIENCPALLGTAWNNLAVIHRERGETARAAACQQQSWRTAFACAVDESTTDAQATDLGNLANDAILAGNLQLAERLLNVSLADDIRRGDLADAAADFGNLGIVSALAGRFEHAQNHFQRALQLHTHLGDDRGQGCDLGHLAELAIVLSDWSAAQEFATRSLFHLERGGCHDLTRRASRTLREINSRRRLAAFDPARN